MGPRSFTARQCQSSTGNFPLEFRGVRISLVETPEIQSQWKMMLLDTLQCIISFCCVCNQTARIIYKYIIKLQVQYLISFTVLQYRKHCSVMQYISYCIYFCMFYFPLAWSVYSANYFKYCMYVKREYIYIKVHTKMCEFI